MLLMILQPTIVIALVATFLFGCAPKDEELDNESPDVSPGSEHPAMENPSYNGSLNYFQKNY